LAVLRAEVSKTQTFSLLETSVVVVGNVGKWQGVLPVVAHRMREWPGVFATA